MTTACLPRGKAALAATLDALDVHRPEWQRNYGGQGWTHCNQAAEAALLALEAHIPKGLLANAQQAWLASADGKAQQWTDVDAQVAGDAAERGEPTVVTLREDGHGHIAVVRGRDPHGNLLVWQAGQQNFTSATLRQCFTVEQLGRVKFFTHP